MYFYGLIESLQNVFMYMIRCSCHSCQKEFSHDEYSNVSIHGEYIKERCKVIFQKVFVVSACIHIDICIMHVCVNIVSM